jgi:hypothetical protein
VVSEQVEKMQEDQLDQQNEEAQSDPLMNLIKLVKPDFESEGKRKIKIHSKINQLANVTKEEFEIYNEISNSRAHLDISVKKEH